MTNRRNLFGILGLLAFCLFAVFLTVSCTTKTPTGQVTINPTKSSGQSNTQPAQPAAGTPANNGQNTQASVNVPDFSTLGFSTVLDDETIGSQGYATITTDQFTIEIEAGTFSHDVEFQLLTADPNQFQDLVPDNETAILAFAFKVTDISTNDLVGQFNLPVTLYVYDENLSEQSNYYNLAPARILTLNDKGLQAYDDELIHPISGAMAAWIITTPTNSLEENLTMSPSDV